MWRRLTKALRDGWRLSVPGGGAYRPDLHYMRGPGPKWHAKYGHSHPKAQPTTNGPAGPGMHNLAERRA